MAASSFLVYRYVLSTILLTAVEVITRRACEGAKILAIFPLPAKSHFQTNEAVLQSLMDAGHEVTIITSFPKEASSKNYTAIIDSSKGVTFQIGREKKEVEMNSVLQVFKHAGSVEMPFCQKVLDLKEIQDMLNSKEERLYDVIFVEILMVHNCYLHVAEKLQIPVIGVVTFRSWLYADHSINNHFNPAYLPLEQFNIRQFETFYDRLVNVWDVLQAEYYWYSEIWPFLTQFHEQNQQNFLAHGISTEAYLRTQPSLIFYNSHFSYLPRPMNPNAIEIGGIHIKQRRRPVEMTPQLPQEMKIFIESAEHGVILFSLGSVLRADTINRETLDTFTAAFSEIPQRVIWKFESNMENLPSNVLTAEWIPQREILAHEKVIAFISHCGQGSVYEAIDSATPVISTPIFADQISNSILLEKLNVAIYLGLDINSISKDDIVSAVNTITNGRYLESMRKLSKTFKDRPMSPEETVVYWTEYVIRYKGAPHLQTAANKLNWFQYYLLDIISFVGLSVILLLYIIYRLTRLIYYSLAKYKRNSVTFLVEPDKDK